MKLRMLLLVGIMAVGAFGVQLPAGKYPVLQFNENHSSTGILTIVQSEDRLGYEMAPIDMASNGVSAMSLTTPAEGTSLDQNGITVRQEYKDAQQDVVIEYQNYGAFLIIESTDCGGALCSGNKITVGLEGSFGQRVDIQEFFAQRAGEYQVSLSGGETPKPFGSTLRVVANLEEGKDLILAPYCDKEETFCDPGYLVFERAKTKIFQRSIHSDHEIFDIFLTEGHGKGYYRWERRGANITLKNIQYHLPGGRLICLEHEFSKR